MAFIKINKVEKSSIVSNEDATDIRGALQRMGSKSLQDLDERTKQEILDRILDSELE